MPLSGHDERVQRGIADTDLLDPNMLPWGADTAHLDLSPLGTGVVSDAKRGGVFKQRHVGQRPGGARGGFVESRSGRYPAEVVVGVGLGAPVEAVQDHRKGGESVSRSCWSRWTAAGVSGSAEACRSSRGPRGAGPREE